MDISEIKDPKLREAIQRQWAAEDQARGPGRPKSRVTVVCKCGKVFEACPSSNRKYCSLACAYASEERSFRPIKERGTRICDGCGVEYQLTTQNKDTQYCSHNCFTRFVSPNLMRANRRESIRDERTWLNLNCEHCGKPFERRKVNVIDSGHVYCSITCGVNGGRQRRGILTKIKNGSTTAEHNYSKAKRGWREIDGKRIFFRSRMEANYARYLSFLKIEWEYEPKTFLFEGVRRGAISYLPDFYLPIDDRYVECKGWMDPKSKTKLRRMAKYFPEVRLTVIDWKQYLAIERSMSKIIPGWELA